MKMHLLLGTLYLFLNNMLMFIGDSYHTVYLTDQINDTVIPVLRGQIHCQDMYTVRL